MSRAPAEAWLPCRQCPCALLSSCLVSDLLLSRASSPLSFSLSWKVHGLTAPLGRGHCSPGVPRAHANHQGAGLMLEAVDSLSPGVLSGSLAHRGSGLCRNTGHTQEVPGWRLDQMRLKGQSTGHLLEGLGERPPLRWGRSCTHHKTREITAKTVRVSSCSRCCDQVPRTRGLTNSRHLFLPVLEAGHPRLGCHRGWRLMGTPSRGADSQLACVCMWWRCQGALRGLL